MKEEKSRPKLEIVGWPKRFADESITTISLRKPKPGLPAAVLGITCAVVGAFLGWIAHALLTGGHAWH